MASDGRHPVENGLAYRPWRVRRLLFEGAAEAGEHEGHEGEAAAAVFAGGAFDELPEAGRLSVSWRAGRGRSTTDFGRAGRGLRDRAQSRILAAASRLRMAAMPSGSLAYSASLPAMMSLPPTRPLRRSRMPLIVRGLEHVVGDQQSFGVLSRCGGEPTFELKLVVDGKRFEGNRICHAVS